MRAKRNTHKELLHAQGHLENCKTSFLMAECIIKQLLENELKKQRKDDKVSEDFNKEITKNMEDQ